MSHNRATGIMPDELRSSQTTATAAAADGMVWS
jgi:hypothetical protein